MAIKNIQIRPVGVGDYGDVLHPETNINMVIDIATGKTVDQLKANKQLESRIQATLGSGWTHGSGSYSPVTYYKDSFGIVHLEGVALGTTTSANIITTLPVGYRPIRNEWLPVMVNIGGSLSIINANILTDGTINRLKGADAVYFSNSFRVS